MSRKEKKGKGDSNKLFTGEDFLEDNVEVKQTPIIEEADEKPVKKPKKTLKQKLRYRGKYELLPEKENRKQLRFYHRLFIFKYTGLVTGIFAVAFAFGALRYNKLLSISAILIALPGLFWGLTGLFKIRRFALIPLFTGLFLNVAAIALAAIPLIQISSSFGTIWQMIMDYITAAGAMF